MANTKKSFLLYTDLIHTVTHLTDEQKGKLFIHILEYVNDQEPETDDLIIKLAFEPIKQSLKRDLVKYTEIKKERSDSGKLGNLKRYKPNLYRKVLSKEITLEKALELAKSRKTSHSDKNLANLAVNDSVSVSVSVSDSIKKNITKKSVFNFRKELIHLGATEQLALDWLKVRKAKKASNTETAFNLFVKELEKSKKNINQVLEICIDNSWKGFKSDWIQKPTSQNSVKKSAATIIQEKYGLS